MKKVYYTDSFEAKRRAELGLSPITPANRKKEESEKTAYPLVFGVFGLVLMVFGFVVGLILR